MEQSSNKLGQIMYSKQKKNKDSLLALQRDINQLGAIQYIKQKKKKFKVAKVMADNEKQKTLEFQYQNRLPSLYEKGDGTALKKKLYSLHNDHHSTLIERIKEFQNRIYSLEAQNILQKKQNQRLIEHVAVLKHEKIVANESKRYREPQIIQQPIYQSIPQTIPQPFPFPTFMPMPQMMSYPGMNPYQMGQMGQMYPMQQQQAQTNKQQRRNKGKKLKFGPLARFRIAGYVVYFSLFFPKYAKSFTLNRFDRFKQAWGNQQYIIQARENLGKYFRDSISLDIFQREDINQLDSLQNLEEQQKQPSSTKIKKEPNKKEQSESESADSSDVDSSEQQSQPSKKPQNKVEQQDSNIFQFYLKIDIAVSFVFQFIKQICQSISKEQFSIKNPFLTLFLPRQFQPDRLHDDADFKYLNMHKEKGYTQNQNAIVQYLMIKNIFMYVFVEKALLSQFGKRFYIDKKKRKDKTTENKVFFSFFIRTSIFKIMVDQYLKNKISQCKEFQLPKEELCPFAKQFGNQNPLKNDISFQNNGIDMREENVHEISGEEMQKKEEQLKNCLDQCCKTLMKKYVEYRRKNQYSVIKQKTLGQKFRTQGPSYFHLHTKQELTKEQNKKTSKIKTLKSSLLNSSKYSQVESDKISIVKRLPKNLKTKKAI